MKNYLTILALALTVQLLYSQEKKPVSFEELMQLSKKNSRETISSSDRISMVATDIYLVESDGSRPDKILEINCKLVKFDGTEITYSTVHRQVFKAKQEGEPLDQGFFLFRDVSLFGVEKLQLTIGVRSLNEDQSKLFKIFSNIITPAIQSVPVIQTMKDLIKTEGNVDEEIPRFNATFYVANNYINFEKIKSEKLKLPFLSPIKGNNIAFESTSRNIPKNILKNIGNLILGGGTFEDKENIGGVLVIKATKETPKPPVKPVMDKLFNIYRTIRASKTEELPNVIAEANATINIVYSDPSDQSSSAFQNANFYISLVDCYYKYQKSIDLKFASQFYDSFTQWNLDKKNYSAEEDYSPIPVKGVYSLYNDESQDNIRIVDFYAPNNLGNEFVNQCLFIQNLMHTDYKLKNEVKDKIKLFTYLIKKD